MDNCYDVIVLGGGAAGMATAIAAAHSRLSVLIVEKTDRFGGTMARSGGCIWVPGNHIAAAAGYIEAESSAETYIRHHAGTHFDSARVTAFLEHGPKAIRFFVEESELNFLAAKYPDYYPKAPGGVDMGRTLYTSPFNGRQLGRWLKRLALPIPEHTFIGLGVGSGADFQHFMNASRSLTSALFVGRRLAAHAGDILRYGQSTQFVNGQALAGQLLAAALKAGVTFLDRTQTLCLTTQGGGVTGIMAQTGKDLREIQARCDVVLATGGYSWNSRRRMETFPHVAAGGTHHSLTGSWATGDGAELAEAASGTMQMSLSDAGAWSPASQVPRRDGSTGTYFHLVDRAKPGVIAIDSSGRRFANESLNYHAFTRAMIKGIEADPKRKFYLLTDRRGLRYGLGAVLPFPIPHAHHIRSGYLKHGATIEMLAAHLNLPAQQLMETIARNNTAATAGRDDDFGKGSDVYQTYMGDSAFPNPCLGPIARGPFYAVELVVSDLGTFAGLATDAKTRVLRADGTAVGGLHAVGNDATSIFGGAYPGAGATLGPALVFGHLCGTLLAEG